MRQPPSVQALCRKCGDFLCLAHRYVLDEVVGVGATGKTYRARSLRTLQTVAVKELWPDDDAAGAEHAAEELRREVEALKVLDHPGVPRFREYFSIEGPLSRVDYLVRDFVPGRSLHQLAEGRPMPKARVFRYVARTLEVLAYLHGREPSVAHGDIKPMNVLVRDSDGQAVLIDFACATGGDLGAELARRGDGPVGTVGFMAPEQEHGRVEPASDLYAIGAVALRLISGVPLREVLDTKHRVVRRLARDLDDEEAAWLERLLARDPADRPRCGAAALADQARQMARRVERRDRRERLVRRGVPVVIGALVMGAAVVLALMTLS